MTSQDTTIADGLTLVQISTNQWIIRDGRRDQTGPDGAIARIWLLDTDEYEVDWLREPALSTYYSSPADVLDDLHAWFRRTKPIPIPHYPPARDWVGGEGSGALPA